MKKLLTIITALLIIPIISAQRGIWSYYSPLDYLENEWVLFAILFLIFFAVIFYTLSRIFKDNKVVPAIIALGFSLFISLAIARRGLLWGYGSGIDSWVLLIAILIGIAFLIRFASQTFGSVATIITTFIIWLILYNLEPSNLLPHGLASGGFLTFYESLFSIPGLVILLIITWALTKGGRKTVKDFQNKIEEAIVRH